MNRVKKLNAGIVAGAFLILSFQNCSKVGFSQKDTSSNLSGATSQASQIGASNTTARSSNTGSPTSTQPRITNTPVVPTPTVTTGTTANTQSPVVDQPQVVIQPSLKCNVGYEVSGSTCVPLKAGNCVIQAGQLQWSPVGSSYFACSSANNQQVELQAGESRTFNFSSPGRAHGSLTLSCINETITSEPSNNGGQPFLRKRLFYDRFNENTLKTEQHYAIFKQNNGIIFSEFGAGLCELDLPCRDSIDMVSNASPTGHGLESDSYKVQLPNISASFGFLPLNNSSVSQCVTSQRGSQYTVTVQCNGSQPESPASPFQYGTWEISQVKAGCQ